MVPFLATVHCALMLSDCQADRNHCCFGSLSADKGLICAFQPFCSHTLPLCLHMLSQTPLSSHPISCQPPVHPARQPGCDYTSLPTPAAVHQAAKPGGLKVQPESPFMHISTFPLLRSPSMAQDAHFYSQYTAVAHSHTGTGTSLVTVVTSFLTQPSLSTSSPCQLQPRPRAQA